MTTIVISLGVVVLLLAGTVVARRWFQRQERREQVQTEDALKHLFHAEEQAQTGSLVSISGALGVSADRAAQVTQSLTNEGLVALDGERVRLTEKGRTRALGVIRRHRLYERYLADETGVQATDWHIVADKTEHRLSAQEVETLAHRLGEPLYDPHGDPIPPVAGTMPSQRGGPLQTAPPGATVMVVHIEDEPLAVYRDLLSKGLQPGVRLRVVERTQRSVVVDHRGVQETLPLVVASNVTVVSAPPEPRGLATLNSLRIGSSARVVGIDEACRGLQRRRMLDLGLVPGTVVTSELLSPGGDPVAYRIRGSLVALRHAQASLILIESTEGRL